MFMRKLLFTSLLMLLLGVSISFGQNAKTFEVGNYGTEIPENYTQNHLVYKLNYDKTAYTLIGPDETNPTSVTIPAMVNGLPVTGIGEAAFKDHWELVSLSFAEGCNVDSIGKSAFSGTCITQLDLTPCKKLRVLNEYAFFRCEKLLSARINKSLERFEGQCQFNGCVSLKEITFEDGCLLENLSPYSFQNSRNLVRIRIPASVKVLDTEAFGWGGDESCLEEVTFEEGSQLEKIAEKVFRDCKALKTCDLSPCKKLKTILWEVFWGCNKLTTVNIDQCTSLENLEGSVFRETALESITLPASMKTIKGACFLGCNSLTHVACLSTTPPLLPEADVFSQDTYATTLYVPEGSKSLYMQAEGWNLFAKIEEETATAIDAVFENKGKSRMYNLSGMAVGDDYHGIVIVDGKKVVR